MMILMKSKSDFHNPRVVKDDGTHTVTVGERFKTDFQHAKDLVAGKLAELIDSKALDVEPTEPMEPHSSISAPDLQKINEGRAERRKAAEAKTAA